ncbi:hypothetical protein KAI87_16680 [Myxococcota bacterium]|nr:hypothetical protein [Myxococcota bacterium]
MKYLVMVFAASLALLGCDSESDSNNDIVNETPVADPVAIEDLPVAYAASACTWFWTCCDSVEQISELDYTSEEACIADITGKVEGDLSDFEPGIAAGIIIYSEEDAGACVAAIEAAACGGDFEEVFSPPACDATFVGTIAVGDACADSMECAGDRSWCDDYTDVCLAETTVDAGGSCADNHAYCEAGFFCNQVDICTSMPVEGEECYFGTCAAGFACSYQPDFCVTPFAEGDSCQNDSQCASGFFCIWPDESTALPDGICSVTVPNGSFCRTSESCLSGDCDWRNQVCVDKPAPTCDGI